MITWRHTRSVRSWLLPVAPCTQLISIQVECVSIVGGYCYTETGRCWNAEDPPEIDIVRGRGHVSIRIPSYPLSARIGPASHCTPRSRPVVLRHVTLAPPRRREPVHNPIPARTGWFGSCQPSVHSYLAGGAVLDKRIGETRSGNVWRYCGDLDIVEESRVAPGIRPKSCSGHSRARRKECK